jgi:hypothetical protein
LFLKQFVTSPAPQTKSQKIKTKKGTKDMKLKKLKNGNKQRENTY